jgi:5-methylcytosine-specific restriction enzyme subunit McrC
MNVLTIFEFEKVLDETHGSTGNVVPQRVFSWLESQCLRTDEKTLAWLKLTQLHGRRAIQITNYVGVIRAPCGFQIEVLPKIGKNTTQAEARDLLIKMLSCLVGFRHIKTASADLATVRMPLLEVFIQQFLDAVGLLVKRGLRSDYVAKQDNLFALRGKLLVSQHISRNLVRRDRFFTEHDEFTSNRAENRLIHSALRCVLAICRSQENQRAARELCFVFSEVPFSTDVANDIQRIRLNRGMNYYASALDWAKLILLGVSPISSAGDHHAYSLLFPMEAVFEAYVEKHLTKQLRDGYFLKAQARSKYLVEHDAQLWFLLKPDLLVRDKHRTHLLLDAKWKLLDAAKNNRREKYQLSQADFYQLYAYGHRYLDGRGDMVLIYPKTDAFAQPLPVFAFPQTEELRLWVLPFCLSTRRLILPEAAQIQELFSKDEFTEEQAVNSLTVPA